MSFISVGMQIINEPKTNPPNSLDAYKKNTFRANIVSNVLN